MLLLTSEYLTIAHQIEIETLFTYWKGDIELNALEKGLEKIHLFLQHKQLSNIIDNTIELTCLPIEAQAYWQKTRIEFIKQHPALRQAQVVGDNSFARFVSLQFDHVLRKEQMATGKTNKVFTYMHEATRWIAGTALENEVPDYERLGYRQQVKSA